MSNSKHRKEKRKSSIKEPALFPEVGRSARELFEKGYIKDHEFSISTRTGSGVTLTSKAVKHRKTSHLAAKYSYKDAAIDAKVDTKSNLSANLTFSRKLLPSTKTTASFKLPDYSSSELKILYYHEHVALAASILLNQFPTALLSASIGTPKITFAVEAKYKSKICSANYNAGISVANAKCNASIILTNQGDLLKASYVHRFILPKKIAVGAEVTRKFSTKENTCTFGGSCRVDNLTTVKVKLNNHGKLETVLQHKIIPTSYLSITADFNLKALEKKPRIGLALALIL